MKWLWTTLNSPWALTPPIHWLVPHSPFHHVYWLLPSPAQSAHDPARIPNFTTPHPPLQPRAALLSSPGCFRAQGLDGKCV